MSRPFDSQTEAFMVKQSNDNSTLVYLISVYTLLNVYRGILTIESERVHLEMVPNKRVQWIFPILPYRKRFMPLVS